MKKIVIDDFYLNQIDSMQLFAKYYYNGLFGGNNKSKSYGSSCDFADEREYIAGDDVTKIDWNAYARTENLYTKRYQDERRLHTKIYIDASRSMDFGMGNKAEQAVKIATFVSYLSICSSDKASVYIIKGNKVEDVLVNLSDKEGFFNNIGKINDIEFSGEINIGEAICQHEDTGYGDGLSIIISDYLTDNDYESAIDHLISKRRQVLCVQSLTSDEFNPKLRGKMHLFDSEDYAKTYRKNITRRVLKAYEEARDYVTTKIKEYCEARNVDYLLVSDLDSMGEIFFNKMVKAGIIK